MLSMKDHMGNWLNKEREIASFVRQGFLDLLPLPTTVSLDRIGNPHSRGIV